MPTDELDLDAIEAPLHPDARMDAYYYGFGRTGVAAVDAILSAVAVAGKGAHSTDRWGDEDTAWYYEDDRPGLPPGAHATCAIDLIQKTAAASADVHRALVAEVRTLRAERESLLERIAGLAIERVPLLRERDEARAALTKAEAERDEREQATTDMAFEHARLRKQRDEARTAQEEALDDLAEARAARAKAEERAKAHAEDKFEARRLFREAVEEANRAQADLESARRLSLQEAARILREKADREIRRAGRNPGSFGSIRHGERARLLDEARAEILGLWTTDDGPDPVSKARQDALEEAAQWIESNHRIYTSEHGAVIQVGKTLAAIRALAATEPEPETKG